MNRSRSRSRTPSPARSGRYVYTSTANNNNNNNRRSRRRDTRRGYSLPRDRSRSQRRKSEVKLMLCVYHGRSHNWSTAPVKYNPSRINDRELWQDIRDTFRHDLRHPLTRWMSFTHVTSIVPIAFTPGGVPLRTKPKDFPEGKQLRHAYHHPEDMKAHYWVDYFTEFDAGDKRQNGLEFVEGLWAEKLAAVAVLLSIAIVAISIGWCALGGDLQTVFTVMGFVLTFIAAEIALVALYYQVATSGSDGDSDSNDSSDS